MTTTLTPEVTTMPVPPESAHTTTTTTTGNDSNANNEIMDHDNKETVSKEGEDCKSSEIRPKDDTTAPPTNSGTASTSNSSTTSVTEGSAEELKELGNQAFAQKNYQEAIRYYSGAIIRDPKSHIYYSNRSASYAGLAVAGDSDLSSRDKYWKLASDDAKECIRLDPSFLKGYYRLATSQVELKQYDLAAATIRQGLTLDSNNIQLVKLMRTVQKQKAVAKQTQSNTDASSSSAPFVSQSQDVSSLDPSIVNEIREIQSSYAQAHRELNVVQANLMKTQRELKLNELTRSELLSSTNTSKTDETKTEEKLEEEVKEENHASDPSPKYYRSIGKMFVLQKSQNDVIQHLLNRYEQYEKDENEMKSKIQYLQNKMSSYQKNVEELMKEHQQSTKTLQT